MERQQEEAVEAEDFEAAAALDSEIAALQGQAQVLQEQLKQLEEQVRGLRCLALVSGIQLYEWNHAMESPLL